MRNKSRWVQIAGSLLFLYVAAACFAIGIGICAVMLAPRHMPLSARLMEPVLVVLWGLTFGGYALLLWPLAYVNHWIVWEAAPRDVPACPSIPLTALDVRTFGFRIMSLSALGYAASAVFHTILTTVGPARSMLPWWVITDVMRWSAWLIVGDLVWLFAPTLALGARCAAGTKAPAIASYREILGVAGFAIVVFPLLSFAATLVVTAIKVSLLHSWATEGTVLSARYFYRSVLRTYLPWCLVGGGLIGIRRLLGGR
jgi:hypothetical protein